MEWIANVVFIVAGCLVIGQAIIMIGKKDISKMNMSQCRYVKNEDRDKFAVASGVAVLVLGISAILSAVINLILATKLGYIALAIGFIAYVVMLLKVQSKYNKEPENNNKNNF